VILRLLAFALTVFFTLLALADDFKTINGKEYKNENSFSTLMPRCISMSPAAFTFPFFDGNWNWGALHMKPEEFLLTIAQAPSYIPGGARSFWHFIGLLLLVIGVLSCCGSVG
jgi:hypothetical protein